MCTGSETRLIACPSRPVGVHDCEDAGVRCAVSGILGPNDIGISGGIITVNVKKFHLQACVQLMLVCNTLQGAHGCHVVAV